MGVFDSDDIFEPDLTFLVDLLSIVEQGLCSASPDTRTYEQNVLLKQYSALLPSMSRRKGPASTLVNAESGIEQTADPSGHNVNGFWNGRDMPQSLGLWPSFDSFDATITAEHQPDIRGLQS